MKLLEIMFAKILLICAWAVLINSEFSPMNLPVKRYCSAALSEALKLTCESRYATMGEYEGDGLMKGKRFGERLSERGGLVHECCMRPCGYNELKKYCLP